MTKRKIILSPHQKHMRFLTCLFGAVMVLSAIVLLLLCNSVTLATRLGPRFH